MFFVNKTDQHLSKIQSSMKGFDGSVNIVNVENISHMHAFAQYGPYYAYAICDYYKGYDLRFRFYDNKTNMLIHLHCENLQDDINLHRDFKLFNMIKHNYNRPNYLSFSGNSLTITHVQEYNPSTKYYVDEDYNSNKTQPLREEGCNLVTSILCKHVVIFSPHSLKLIDSYKSPRFNNYFNQEPSLSEIDNKFLIGIISFIKMVYSNGQIFTNNIVKVTDAGKTIEDVEILIYPKHPKDIHFKILLEMEVQKHHLTHLSTYCSCIKSVKEHRMVIGRIYSDDQIGKPNPETLGKVVNLIEAELIGFCCS